MTDKEVKALKPADRPYKKGIGEGLRIEVMPNGSKYIRGRFKGRNHPLGSYPDIGLKEAKRVWREVKSGITEIGKSGHTLGDLVREWEEIARRSGEPKEATRRDYMNKIRLDILPRLGEETDLRELEWDKGGREKCVEMKRRIEDRGSKDTADKTFMIARMLFNLAIERRWMKGDNPAISSKYTRNNHRSTPHPTLRYGSQLKEFLSDIDASTTDLTTNRMIKLDLLTAVRVGTLAQMQWEQIEFDKSSWIIPWDAPGVKRNHGCKENHYVPLVKSAIKIIEKMRFNDDNPYVFRSYRPSKLGYCNPYSLNKAIRDIENGKYKGKQTAHGFRALIVTSLSEEAGIAYEVVDKLLGHINGSGDKIRRAYDRTEWFQQRREALERWEEMLFDCGFALL